MDHIKGPVEENRVMFNFTFFGNVICTHARVRTYHICMCKFDPLSYICVLSDRS